MKAENKGNCFECGVADLEQATIELKGTVRGKDYTVSMQGLKCPNCGFQTIEGEDMPEFGRLLADEYRRAHRLLTSRDIVALRDKFNESQEAFAKRAGVGVASIKRWELGKIQDPDSDKRLREVNEVPTYQTLVYSFMDAQGSTAQFLTDYVEYVWESTAIEPLPTESISVAFQEYFDDAGNASVYCGGCEGTGSGAVILTHGQIPPAYLASQIDKERRSRARHA